MKKQIQSYVNTQKMMSNYDNGLPQTYFQLVEKVGSKGKYQFNIFLLFSLIYFMNGVNLSNTSFLFYAKQFQCQFQGLLVQDCQLYICSLEPSERQKYLFKQQDDIVSVMTDFGPLKCEDQFYADLAMTSVYFGSFISILIFSSISDNYGRRLSIIIVTFIAALGNIMVSSATNIYVLSIGLILSGGGTSSACNIAYLFYGQVVQNQKRQKYSLLTQLAYSVGTVVVIIFYYLIRSWRIISIITTTIPCLVALFFVVMYVEQTPQFLLNGDNKKSLKALNRIGRINFKLNDLVSEMDIKNVKRFQKFQKVKTEENAIQISPLDLLKFSSLRTTTICIWLMNFLVYQMYYGPSLIIDQIGFDIFVTSFALQITELLIYIPTYPYIQKIKRKTAGIVVYIITIICCVVLLLNEKPQNCDICFQSVLQLFIVLIFKSSICFYFILLLIYNVQIYPCSAAGLGSGTALAAGTIGSTICPLILGLLYRMDLGFMYLFMVYGIIGIGTTTILRETQGVPLLAQIQQVAKIRQKHIQQQEKSLLCLEQPPSSSQIQDKTQQNKN